jgi:hypothetical protein
MILCQTFAPLFRTLKPCIRRVRRPRDEQRREVEAVAETFRRESERHHREYGRPYLRPKTLHQGISFEDALLNLLKHVDKGCTEDPDIPERMFVQLEKYILGLPTFRRLGTTSINEALHRLINILIKERSRLELQTLHKLIMLRVSFVTCSSGVLSVKDPIRKAVETF